MCHLGKVAPLLQRFPPPFPPNKTFTPHPLDFRATRSELSPRLLRLCVPGDDGSPESSVITLITADSYSHEQKRAPFLIFLVISTFVPTLLRPRTALAVCVASKMHIVRCQSFAEAPPVRSAYLLAPHSPPLCAATHQSHLQDRAKRVLTWVQPSDSVLVNVRHCGPHRPQSDNPHREAARE